MDSVRIYFKVQDFPEWKKVFDEDVKSGLLEKAGVTKYDLQRVIESGETSLYFELKSSSQFKEYMKSDINKQRLSQAGVVGEPRLEFMERVEEKRIGGEKAA